MSQPTGNREIHEVVVEARVEGRSWVLAEPITKKPGLICSEEVFIGPDGKHYIRAVGRTPWVE